ncbi:MAG: hypothetical protein M1379_14615 [Firmicutes bacterium]|nr:hypothetical protein [Bacillota bacterium]
MKTTGTKTTSTKITGALFVPFLLTVATALAVTVALLTCSLPSQAAGPEIGGWVQAGVIVSGSPAGAWEGGVTDLRLNFSQAEGNVTLKASLDFLNRFGNRELFPDLMPVGTTLPPRFSYAIHQASLRLDRPSGFLQIGRDNLSLSTGRSFNLFEPFSPGAPWIAGGEKPPVDFWYFQQNFGRNDRLGIALVFATDTQTIPDGINGSAGGTVENIRNIKAARFNHILPEGEFSLIGITDPAREQDIYGLDLFGQWEVGYWLSAARVSRNSNQKNDPVDQYVLGTDYTLPVGNGVYLSAECFYDGSGGTSANECNWADLRSGKRATLGSRYLALRQRYNINDFWSEEIAGYRNLDDEGTIISPHLTYLYSQDTEIALGADLVSAESGSEFNPGPSRDPAGLLGHNRFYLSFKKVF